METEIEITGSNARGWFEKIKNWSYENWQTILVILIVLIVGMSAYNYNQENDSSAPATAITENASEDNDIAKDDNNSEAVIEDKDEEIAAQEDNKVAIEQNETSTEITKEVEKEEVSVSKNTESGKQYTITAVYGEGITHLARHAMDEYIQETGDGSDLSQEHKVYVEDYIQNRTGNQKINEGHQETFSESLIAEAIINARSLSPESIQNLAKYIQN